MELVSKQLTQKENLDVAHHNTILSQLLQLIPRHVFDDLERKHATGRKARVFTRWSQFVCLAFIHLGARPSMRDGLRNLDANPSRLYHLGLKPVARSTFSDANNKRPADFFADLFCALYKRCEAISPGHKFRFKNKLFSLDASTIKLCLSAFPWASFRKNRGGIKLHTLLDHDGYIPAFVHVTNARRHEAKLAKTLKLPKGSIVVFDKAYISYLWFQTLIASGVHFVTRQKTNASYKVLKRRPVNRKQGVTSDQEIEVTVRGKALKLRRVGYRDPETGKHYVFLTSHFTLSAKTIAEIYKERWQIEIFFRLIKQTLKLKSFVGNSENAVLSQIYVAMIVHLLLAYLKFRSKIGWSLQEMLQLLQLNVFKRTELEAFFKPPDRMSKIDRCYPLLAMAS
jgi:hypothetical protein